MSTPTGIAVGVITACLVLATVVIFGISFKHPERDNRALEQRIKSWWMICGFFFGAILAGGGCAIFLFMLLSYLAFKEYVSLIPMRSVDHRVLFWAYVSIPLQYLWIYIGWYGMFIIFMPVFMFLIIPMRLVSLQQTDGFLRSAGLIHWGLMVTVFCLSHTAWLFALPMSTNPQAGSGGWVLYLVGLTELNDIAQYMAGKTWGRRKILPGVSPNKTWAGFLGGVVFTSLLSAAIAPFLTPFGMVEGLCLGAGIAAFGFLGDVTVSALKRDLGVKDSGSLLPGHGGILDRVDSLLFTAPLFVHYLRYYYS